jgi:hypothetical protein
MKTGISKMALLNGHFLIANVVFDFWFLTFKFKMCLRKY